MAMQRAAIRLAAGLAALALLAGCASAPPRPPPLTGTGSYQPVHGADTRRYVLSAGEAFSGATLARFENPQY
ncbi:MAG: hypothetical protein ACYCZI_04055, partial [Metallibacterium scheffleri]